MRVTFLAHDGFFIELDTLCLLFDWWKEPVPSLPDKPLLVFVSHRHEDHFNPEVFTLAAQKLDMQFLLGSDLRLTPRNLEKWHLAPETAAKCRRCGKHDVWEPLPGVTVETFPSTDEGVAWMVTAEGRTIFHAGDLDPRLGKDGYLGPEYFLELMDVRHFLPMHQWDDFAFTDQFLAAYPQFAPITTKIHHNSEIFTF